MGAGFLEPGESEVFLKSTVGLRARCLLVPEPVPVPLRAALP